MNVVHFCMLCLVDWLVFGGKGSCKMATKFYKKSEKTWYVKFKDIDKKWKSKSCGKNATASDAEVIRKNYDAMELNRKHKVCVRIVDTGIIEQLKNYRETEIPKSKTGVKKSLKSTARYQAIVDNFISFLEDGNKLRYSDVSEQDITSFIDSLIELNRSTSTLSKYREVLIRFFNWSIKKFYCTENPALGIDTFKRKTSIPRYFSEEELEKIFNAAKGQYKRMFQFLYLTGLRAGELCNLRWSDYIESESSIIIRVMEGNKTKREGKVPLNDDAVSVLSIQKENRNAPDSFTYIFTNEAGSNLDDANIYRNLKTILKNEKISDAKVHTFRHTCASHLVIKGVSLYIVKDILRHASIRETEIYAHLSKEAVGSAIKLLSLKTSSSELQRF